MEGDIVGEGKFGIAMGLQNSYSDRFGNSHKRYKCNRHCPCLTDEPRCKCDPDILEIYFKKYGRFKIIKGKYGDGCPIYMRTIKDAPEPHRG